MTQKEIDDANYKLAVQLSNEMEEALGPSPFYRGTGMHIARALHLRLALDYLLKGRNMTRDQLYRYLEKEGIIEPHES